MEKHEENPFFKEGRKSAYEEFLQILEEISDKAYEHELDVLELIYKRVKEENSAE
jgi:hypothetical protein